MAADRSLYPSPEIERAWELRGFSTASVDKCRSDQAQHGRGIVEDMLEEGTLQLGVDRYLYRVQATESDPDHRRIDRGRQQCRYTGSRNHAEGA
jgi:hypothetical protein